MKKAPRPWEDASVQGNQRGAPYIDFLFERIDQGDVDLQAAFGLHVHWGYWTDIRAARGSIDDFAQAAERLSRRVCDAARVNDGMRVLDVGCGLGGTLASLNSRFHDVDLVGLNIDSRQLKRARQQVHPQPGNRLTYVTADACELPFASESFDAVLAVECIFHFPSRARFLKEVRRVLRPGCLLALSDFVPRTNTFPLLGLMFAFFRASIQRTYGNCNSRCTLPKYGALAKKAGLSSLACEDITTNTLPTYKILRQLDSSTVGFPRHARKAMRFLEWASRAGWLRYLVLTMARENMKTRT